MKPAPPVLLLSVGVHRRLLWSLTPDVIPNPAVPAYTPPPASEVDSLGPKNGDPCTTPGVRAKGPWGLVECIYLPLIGWAREAPATAFAEACRPRIAEPEPLLFGAGGVLTRRLISAKIPWEVGELPPHEWLR